MARRELRIQNRQAEMRSVVALVEQFGTENRLPDMIVNDLNVALDEVLSNVIAYGYEPGAGGEIVVRLTCNRNQIEAEIEDRGKPFDPLQAPAPDLSAPLQDRQVGGLGVHLVRSLMDDVTYTRVSGTNRLRITKKLIPEQPVERGMDAMASETNGVVIIEPHGRIDTTSAKSFGEEVIELIRAGSHHILIDLRHIVYVSSAGFRSFLIARKLVEEVNGKIVLCGMSPELRRLFEIGRFTDLFTICPTRDEGLAKAR